MPQERESQSPAVTPEQWTEISKNTPRHVAAARLIVSSKVRGRIPHRPYLIGDCDHSPVLQGVADFTDAVYNLLDALDDNLSEHDDATKTAMKIVGDMMEEFKA